MRRSYCPSWNWVRVSLAPVILDSPWSQLLLSSCVSCRPTEMRVLRIPRFSHHGCLESISSALTETKATSRSRQMGKSPSLHPSDCCSLEGCTRCCTTCLMALLCFAPISRSNWADGGVRNTRLASPVTRRLHMNIQRLQQSGESPFVNRALIVWC